MLRCTKPTTTSRVLFGRHVRRRGYSRSNVTCIAPVHPCCRASPLLDRVDARPSGRVRDARGGSLAGLLLLIVVLGGLAALAVVGVNSMTGSDSTSGNLMTTPSAASLGDAGGGARVGLGSVAQMAADAACHAEAGIATSASSVYLANSGGKYPAKWSNLSTASFVLPAHVVINPSNPTELDGNGWELTMSGGGTTAPVFACK